MPTTLFPDKSRVRYGYYNAERTAKEKFEKLITSDDSITVTQKTISKELEIDIGTASFSDTDTANITFDITFDETPTLLATPDSDVKLSIGSVTTTSAIITSSATFTGTVYWIAFNKTDTGREMGVLVDRGTMSLTAESTATVEFSKKDDFELCGARYNLTPTILVSIDDNVNVYTSTVSTAGFTLQTSEITTATVYWAAFMVRKL